MLTIADYGLREVLGAEPVSENAKDGTLLGLVPEGEFLAGGAGGDEGGAVFTAWLPAFYLALHPVTNAQYARFLTAARPSKADLERWIALDSACFVRAAVTGYEAYGGEDGHPVVQVSWYGAEAYCAWAGLRLPAELEWEKGARGTDGREYPWGRDWEATKCHGSSRAAGRSCGVWVYAAGASPWGMYQMPGNVLEWCDDWYDSTAYERYRVESLAQRVSRSSALAPTPRGSGCRVVRGGSLLDDDRHFRCAYRSFIDCGRYGPDFQLCTLGFRCARTL